MILRYYGLDDSVEDIITTETGDAYYQGYTYVSQLADFLSRKGLPCYIAQPQDVAASVKQANNDSFPIIYLRYWNLDTLTGGHFTVIRGDADTPFAIINNPWQGVENKWTWDQVNQYALGNYIIVITKKKETVDSVLQAGIAYFETFGAKWNPTALGLAWMRMYRNWVQNGQDDVLNPTPPLYSEWANGTDAYLPLDNGIVLHWHTGKTSQIEAKERRQVFTAAGWPLA